MSESMNHSDVYYILKNNGKDESGNIILIFEPVHKAKHFKNSYGFDLFEIDGNLSEGKSGLRVCSKNTFEDNMQKIGIEKFESMIKNAVEKYGLSPRYAKPNETKKDVFGEEDKKVEHSKLMKPLFNNYGMFNREGKCIRAKYIKTLSCDGVNYPLWIYAGKPDKDYTKNPEDQYYYMIETNGYLVSCGYTEYELKQRSGCDYLNKEWYGDFEGRNKFFDELRKDKTYEEYNLLVKEQIAKEETAIVEYGKNESIQAELLKQVIDHCIAQYIDARDNNGKYANFRGAAFLNELDKCVEVSNRLKAIREQEEKIKQAERKQQEQKEQEEKEEAELKAIAEIENIFVTGGTINDNNLIVKIADKYGINIPIRTRGWILNNLSELTITDSGDMSYRYYKRSKNAAGSKKVYDVLFNIKEAIKKIEIA